MIYFLHISYEGTNYRGWQWQPNVPSVQKEMEDNLKAIFKMEVPVYGCGRTDAGVHASQFMLHIDLPNPIDFDLKFRLNKNLPSDISVHNVLKMEEGQHARYDATSRTYDYFIHLFEDSILHKYSSYYQLDELNIEVMKKATALLPLYNDYKNFCKQPDQYKHTLCNITEAKLYVDVNQQRLRFVFTSDRFLRGMIRLCVSRLLKVGTGKITIEEFELLLANKLEHVEKDSALPNGLYLSKIEYPYLKMEPPPNFCDLLKVGLEN
ncbi:MAG: tRNA pseudouridine(38-40) synthase TruA [Cyclobacteriaceae bacterium]|nr:tRNA pseudouridine(38-40) synthase TruA [Cyclobacteriaceae bacterium]